MFARGFNTASVRRIGNPSSIAARLGLANVASLEFGIDSGRRM